LTTLNGEVRQIAPGRFGERASLSPDGKRIVYYVHTNDTRNNQLLITDLDGGQTKVLDAPYGYKNHPVYAGEKIFMTLAVKRRGGRYEDGIYYYDTTDPGKGWTLWRAGPYRNLTVDPQGRYLAATTGNWRTRYVTSRIWVQPLGPDAAAKGRAYFLATGFTARVMRMAFSADGSMLYFAANPGKKYQRGGNAIYRIPNRPGANSPKRLTSGTEPSLVQAEHNGPDLLVFMRGFDVYLLNTQTKAVKRFFSGSGGRMVRSVSWGRGDSFFFTLHRWRRTRAQAGVFRAESGAVTRMGYRRVERPKKPDSGRHDDKGPDNRTTAGINCLAGDCMNGAGLRRYDSGNVYNGQFKKGERHGSGVMTYHNGAVYKGEWRHNEKHGQGRFYWSKDQYYVGEFRHNQRHGKGTYRWKSGVRYEGEWRNNLQHGRGTLIYPDGRRTEGVWRQGKPVSGGSTMTPPEAGGRSGLTAPPTGLEELFKGRLYSVTFRCDNPAKTITLQRDGVLVLKGRGYREGIIARYTTIPSNKYMAGIKIKRKVGFGYRFLRYTVKDRQTVLGKRRQDRFVRVTGKDSRRPRVPPGYFDRGKKLTVARDGFREEGFNVEGRPVVVPRIGDEPGNHHGRLEYVMNRQSGSLLWYSSFTLRGEMAARTRRWVFLDGRKVSPAVYNARSLRIGYEGRGYGFYAETDRTFSSRTKYRSVYQAFFNGKSDGRRWERIRFVYVSPNGARFAYQARKAGRWYVVVDGRVQGPYPYTRDFKWGPVSDHYLYIVSNREKTAERLVVDGTPRPWHTQIHFPNFDFEGDRWGYAFYEQQRKRHGVIINGTPQNESYNGFVFGPGDHLALFAPLRGEQLRHQPGPKNATISWYVVTVDGRREARPAMGAYYFQFSPNGRHYGYIESYFKGLDDYSVVRIDGKRQQWFPKHGIAYLNFSRDGTRHFYNAVMVGQGGWIVENNRKGPLGKNSSPQFSPDGRYLYYHGSPQEHGTPDTLVLRNHRPYKTIRGYHLVGMNTPYPDPRGYRYYHDKLEAFFKAFFFNEQGCIGSVAKKTGQGRHAEHRDMHFLMKDFQVVGGPYQRVLAFDYSAKLKHWIGIGWRDRKLYRFSF